MTKYLDLLTKVLKVKDAKNATFPTTNNSMQVSRENVGHLEHYLLKCMYYKFVF